MQENFASPISIPRYNTGINDDSLIISDSDSLNEEDFRSIDSFDNYEDTPTYFYPQHLNPVLNAVNSSYNSLNVLHPNVFIFPSPSVHNTPTLDYRAFNGENEFPSPKLLRSMKRPSHVTSVKNGDYYLHCVHHLRSNLVAVSSTGLSILHEKPPREYSTQLYTIVSTVERIALETLGAFEKQCKENINPIRTERPQSSELDVEWCKIRNSVSELFQKFDILINLYENNWKN